MPYLKIVAELPSVMAKVMFSKVWFLKKREKDWGELWKKMYNFCPFQVPFSLLLNKEFQYSNLKRARTCLLNAQASPFHVQFKIACSKTHVICHFSHGLEFCSK